MKLKSIKGLLPAKRPDPKNLMIPDLDYGYNEAIDQIGEKDLPKMDREKLASILYLQKCDPDSLSLTDTDKVMIMEESYREADALISNQDELFECK